MHPAARQEPTDPRGHQEDRSAREGQHGGRRRFRLLALRQPFPIRKYALGWGLGWRPSAKLVGPPVRELSSVRAQLRKASLRSNTARCLCSSSRRNMHQRFTISTQCSQSAHASDRQVPGSWLKRSTGKYPRTKSCGRRTGPASCSSADPQAASTASQRHNTRILGSAHP